MLTLSHSTSVINIPNSEHIHASDKYILSFISVRSFANKKGLITCSTSCIDDFVNTERVLRTLDLAIVLNSWNSSSPWQILTRCHTTREMGNSQGPKNMNHNTKLQSPISHLSRYRISFWNSTLVKINNMETNNN